MKINLQLHGLSLGQGQFRPAMIFKDVREREVLPVWLDPMEVNVLLASSQPGARASSTHSASLKLFDALGVTLKRVDFDEVSGNIQYATVTAHQGKKEVSVRVRASEAMSLVINAGCKFQTSLEVIEKSRALNLEQLLHMKHGEGFSNFEGLH